VARDSGLFELPLSLKNSTINQVKTDQENLTNINYWQSMCNLFSVNMFAVYTSMFESLYRMSMLLNDIKSQTKTVHFS
jgi:hypothetical protein